MKFRQQKSPADEITPTLEKYTRTVSSNNAFTACNYTYTELYYAQITTKINLPPDTCELAQFSGLSQVQSCSLGSPPAAEFVQVHEPKTGETQPKTIQLITQSIN